jgi:hypothetical protein
MAITKTKFINYIRCPNYCVLDKIKKEELDTDISIEDYRNEEKEQIISELLDSMYDDEGEDLIDVEDKQLKVMLPYYNKVELLAGALVEKKFNGKAKYSKDTLNQESFDALIDGIRYLCYVDIYNERKDGFDIVEVKATTTKKFLQIGKGYTDSNGDKQVASIFIKDKDGIYRLREEIENNVFDDTLSEKDFLKHKAKLFNKYNEAGHYVYDLAVQRFIIENDLITNNEQDKISKVKYYLAVLNSDYIFDGNYIDNEPNYKIDENGNDIVEFLDLTNVTKDYMDIIRLDERRINKYITDMSINECMVGEYCEFKKTTKCKFIPVCWNKLPKKNSILAYLDNHYGFEDETGIKHERYDLINEGIVSMLDIPTTWLTRKKNIIQRETVEKNSIYMNEDKIRRGIETIKYPIYHLDFETFPCPLPRYRGEKPYSQSVFQFSLHIETSPGVCDKEKNHYEFLAKDHNDNREELIKKMIEYIDINSGGSIMVYNQAFEKTRIKELGIIFPQYKNQLEKMSNMLFDLMYLIKTNSKFYEELGYEEEDAKLFNYYHPNLNGSFSIKKVLPLFSSLNYTDLDIGNGVEALVTYACFNKMTEAEYNKNYNDLLEYCKQDTWAMVEILNGLRKLVKLCLVYEKQL